MDEGSILDIDADELGLRIASPQLGKEELAEHIDDEEYDRLRIHNRLFTKEYDSDGNLLTIEPFFVDVRLTNPTERVKLVDEYEIEKTGAYVRIYDRLDDVGYLYHITLPEMSISFQELRDLHEELQEFKQTGETENELIQRWYQEFGILEHLLFDPNIQEININPPAYKTDIRIVHEKYSECTSNIYPSQEFLNYLATRLKISSGRPLNKAQPQLDGEITVEGQRARVAAVSDPFSMFGIGYSIRRHREDPWTLQLFIDNHTINPQYAGLMSLAIAHGRTFLTAGPRGSGKTSMLGALILEILPKYRIITVEDTAELPVRAYKDLGYDIVPFKVRSALLEEGVEMPFDKGLRTTLRLGDSSLILGEIRSTEAKVLYEAMRVGAMSNTVAGTIHADTPYGVFDRVVNDLGVPKGSFKVTDLIVIQNQIKTTTGLGRKRRVLQVTEVLKDWEDKPEFQDLLVYNPDTDQLEPTDALLNGESELLNHILERASGYESYKDLLDDIRLRGWTKQEHVRLANGDSDLLEAKYVRKSNTIYTLLFEELNPLESDANEAEFKQRYRHRMKQALRGPED